jgi:imidazolonepropionase-like amidohydrolase
VAAEVCQVDDDVGTLEPGKRADILIVEGDALADITALDQVRRVLRDGATVYDHSAGETVVGLVPEPVQSPRPVFLAQA